MTASENIIDSSKKRAAVRVNPASQSNDQLLYFTSPSVTADSRHLVFISDRAGAPNLFVRDLIGGQERQLTHVKETLKSYIYFDGQPYRGLGKASVSLDVARGIIYYIEGRQIRAVTLGGKQRLLAEYPEGQMTAYTHVSADGTRLCVPTTDARVLDSETILAGRPDYDVDERVRRENLSSFLRIYDTETGDEIISERVPGAWITHVQFSPIDHNILLYNNEWCSVDQGIRRIWIWDGRKHLRLRTQGEGRDRMDYVTHEMWERDGTAIIYHGCYSKESADYNNREQFVGRITPDGSELVEITIPRHWGRYGHYTVGNSGELVTDGYYEEPGDPSPMNASATWDTGAWITLLRTDWANRKLLWLPLCPSGSSWANQDCHPHPIINAAADSVFFTSDKEGQRAIYRVKAPV